MTGRSVLELIEDACQIIRRPGVAADPLHRHQSYTDRTSPAGRVLCPFSIDGTMTTGLSPAHRCCP